MVLIAALDDEEYDGGDDLSVDDQDGVEDRLDEYFGDGKRVMEEMDRQEADDLDGDYDDDEWDQDQSIEASESE